MQPCTALPCYSWPAANWLGMWRVDNHEVSKCPAHPPTHLPRAHAPAAFLAPSSLWNSTKAVPLGLPDALSTTSLNPVEASAGVGTGTFWKPTAAAETMVDLKACVPAGLDSPVSLHLQLQCHLYSEPGATHNSTHHLRMQQARNLQGAASTCPDPTHASYSAAHTYLGDI
jgi:hypothetical protein